MAVVTEEAKTDLMGRFETAVIEAASTAAGLDARPVAVEDQERHIDRAVVCQHSMIGEGWVGSISLLVPEEGANMLAARASGDVGGGTPLKGTDVADAVTAFSTAAAVGFSRLFEHERQVLLGMPVVMKGTDVSVFFPWGNDFECRLSFKSEETPFWAICRLSKTT